MAAAPIVAVASQGRNLVDKKAIKECFQTFRSSFACFVKFQKLVAYLRGKTTNSKWLSKIHKYILVRDATFFVVNFFTGDRASNLGRLLANQVFHLKDH